MYKVGENGKCTEWPQSELEHLTVKTQKYSIYTKHNLPADAQILVCFPLQQAVSKISLFLQSPIDFAFQIPGFKSQYHWVPVVQET